MTNFRADLHCHSTCSDGSLTPKELIELASKLGLQGLSITDHDTIQAYDQLLPLAKQYNIRLIPGVEFSTVHSGKNVHVLAYSFSINHPLILDYCQKLRTNRLERGHKIISLLKEQGITIDADEISVKDISLGRPHIAKILLEKGFVKSYKEAFNLYLGDGKSCYVPSTKITTKETIEFIHHLNGYAIIAHPHLIPDKTLLQEILTLNFDGLEAYYANMTSKDAYWVKFAEEKNLMVTGGSDFHGDPKPNIMLGASWVNEDIFNFLEKRFIENQYE